MPEEYMGLKKINMTVWCPTCDSERPTAQYGTLIIAENMEMEWQCPICGNEFSISFSVTPVPDY